MNSRSRGGVGRAAAAMALVVLLSLLGVARDGAAAPYPPLPVGDDRGFLGNLSVPALAPGQSASLTFTVGDPLPTALSDAALTFEVYAFNGFPGNATGPVAVAGAPVLSNATTSGSSVGVVIGGLAAGGVVHGSVGVATASTTPSGAFAVRSALSFSSNGTEYRLESRGWFNASTWAAATELPNGSATLNLTVLGVSGVSPETAIVVSASSFPTILAGVLVAAAVLVGVGAWIYFRRGPASSSGVARPPDDHQAPSAFGKSRTRDGD